MIYLIGDPKKVKLGYSKDPDKRLKQLQTGSSNKLKLLFVCEGSLKAEKFLHHQFKIFRYRPNSEWYRVEDIATMIDIIKTSVKRFK